VRNYRQGLEDGLVDAFAAVQRDANEEGIEGGGPLAVTVYLAATEHWLDGPRIMERVAEVFR
jgi:hypothetical protein